MALVGRQQSANPLLNKAELGRTTRRGIDLPPEPFVYGIPSADNRGGAAVALSGWSEKHGNNQNISGGLKRSNTIIGDGSKRDFVALNKAATMKGLVTSQDFSKYRATHDVRRQPLIAKENSTNSKDGTRRLPPEMAFGQPTRPCTPVFDLIEHKYLERWLQERREQQLANRTKSRQSKEPEAATGPMKRSKSCQKVSSSTPIYETRASLLRKYLPPIENPEMWQMRRFKKVPSHISTFRSESAKAAAMENQELDGAARFGYLSQGAYATPPY